MANKNFVAAYADMLNATITVQSVSDADDGGGGSVKTYTTRHADVPASIQPIMGSKALFAAKMQMDVSHMIYVGAPITVVNGDRITSGSNTYTVEYFEDVGGTGENFCLFVRLVQE